MVVESSGRGPRGSVAIAISIGVWGAVTAGGFAALLVYSQTPGADARPPALAVASPRSSLLMAGCGKGQFQLVVAVHPRCPCTQATLAELEKLLQRYPDALRATALVYQPKGAAHEWQQAANYRWAQQLPNTQVLADVDAQLARHVGLLVSGAVVLYGADGQPRYYGGITAARGHVGDNLGSQAIASWIEGVSADTTYAPVYGCAIASPDAGRLTEGQPALPILQVQKEQIHDR